MGAQHDEVGVELRRRLGDGRGDLGGQSVGDGRVGLDALVAQGGQGLVDDGLRLGVVLERDDGREGRGGGHDVHDPDLGVRQPGQVTGQAYCGSRLGLGSTATRMRWNMESSFHFLEDTEDLRGEQ